MIKVLPKSTVSVVSDAATTLDGIQFHISSASGREGQQNAEPAHVTNMNVAFEQLRTRSGNGADLLSDLGFSLEGPEDLEAPLDKANQRHCRG